MLSNVSRNWYKGRPKEGGEGVWAEVQWRYMVKKHVCQQNTSIEDYVYLG